MLFIDGVFIAATIVSGVGGFSRGFIRDFLDIAGIVSSIYLVDIYTDEVYNTYVKDYISNQYIGVMVTYFIIFIISIYICKLLANYISKIIKKGPLKAIDRWFGIIAGIGKNCTRICLVYLIFSNTNTKAGAIFDNSNLLKNVFNYVATNPYGKYMKKVCNKIGLTILESKNNSQV